MPVQPHSESPVKVAEFKDAFPAGVTRTLIQAQRDPKRIAYRNAAFQHAVAEMGMDSAQAQMYAHHAANPYRWGLTPFHNAVIRQNSLLPEDSWRMLTDEVVMVARQRQNMVAELKSRGLTMPVPNLGVFTVDWQKMTDLEAAQVAIHPGSNISRDQAAFTRDQVAIPIVYKDFFFRMRDLLAAQNDGIGLDVTHATVATQVVAEKMEQILIDGASEIEYNNATVVGVTNHPSRLTDTFSDFGTPANAETGFRDAITALRNNNHIGPFGVWIAPTQYGQLKQQYPASTDNTAMNFILAQHPEIEFIKENQFLADGEVVFIELARSTIDLAEALDISLLQWDSPAGDGTYLRVMTAGAPRIKVDAESQTGILHATGA